MSTAKQKGVNETPQGMRHGNVNQKPEYAPSMAPIEDAYLMEATENDMNGQADGTKASVPSLPAFANGHDCRSYSGGPSSDPNAGGL